MKFSRTVLYCTLAFFLLALNWILPVPSAAQTPQPAALVIEGGTLIDGNGGTPLRDSVIVIQGNKITAIAQKGKATYPPNAQVIKADGKFITPGLWDARVNHAWFVDEALLLSGITSLIDMAVGGEVQMVHRDAVEHGKIAGPRTFTGIGFISSRPNTVQQFLGTGLETPLMPGRVPKSADDAREITKRLLVGKPDMIVIQDGNLPTEYYRAIVEEAGKTGTPVYARPAGPKVDPKEGILAGINAITHSGDGLGNFVTKDRSKWGNDAIDSWSDLDDAKANELLDLIIQHKITLEPNFVEVAPGLSDKWAYWETEDRRMFSNVALRSYYPPERIDSVLGIYNQRPVGADERARKYKGLMNAVQFHHKVAQRGGRVLLGSDSPSNSAVGNGFHHEMEIFADGGFTPMEIIQSATKWPAEAANALSRVGTIETGKLADLLIVDADPLQDIRNLKKINTIVFNGKTVERNFHSWFRTPFLGNSPNTNPAVDQLPWALAAKQATTRGGGDGEAPAGRGGAREAASSNCGPFQVACDAPANTGRDRLPPPGIETISPIIVTEGSPTLAMKLKGFNFFPRTQVYFDDKPIPYRRVSATELELSIDESLLRSAGRFEIQVKNPPPISFPEWGGDSNRAYLIVNYKY